MNRRIHWRSADGAFHLLSELPASFRPWFLYRGSMTKKMQSICNSVEIVVLREGRERMSSDEALRLGRPYRQAAWIREILMVCDGEPWLMARTVIPLVGQGAGVFQRIRGLGNRPLGQLLFSSPTMARSRYEVACLEISQDSPPVFPMKIELDEARDPLWARRSVFTLKKQPLLLRKCFYLG